MRISLFKSSLLIFHARQTDIEEPAIASEASYRMSLCVWDAAISTRGCRDCACAVGV